MIFESLVFGVTFITLFIATLYDLKKREIPNAIPFLLTAFLLIAFVVDYTIRGDTVFFLNSAFGFLGFLALSFVLFQIRLFEGGDAKLLMPMGIIVGWSLAPYFLLIFFSIGLGWFLIWKGLKIKEVPFTPVFLIAFTIFTQWVL